MQYRQNSDDAAPNWVGPVIMRYTVPFDTPGLSDGSGVILFTPTVGDEILDIAVRFPTVFDGTTPKCDVGTGITATEGLLNAFFGALDATVANLQSGGDGLSFYGGAVPANLLGAIGGAVVGGTPKVTAANPIRAWVTQNGLFNGADPGSTQGVAEIVFTMGTPADLPLGSRI